MEESLHRSSPPSSRDYQSLLHVYLEDIPSSPLLVYLELYLKRQHKAAITYR